MVASIPGGRRPIIPSPPLSKSGALSAACGAARTVTSASCHVGASGGGGGISGAPLLGAVAISLVNKSLPNENRLRGNKAPRDCEGGGSTSIPFFCFPAKKKQMTKERRCMHKAKMLDKRWG